METGARELMSKKGIAKKESAIEEIDLPDHPRGTLAVMLIYALLFVVGWVGLYLFVFLGRGTPQP